jgi:hypothetical protein
MFLVSIPVAFVSGWAYAFWAASALLTRVLQRLRDKGRHATNGVGPSGTRRAS